MITAVLDTGVVVAGIFWKSEPHQCLVAVARRKFALALTDPVFDEYVRVAWRLKREEELTVNPEPWLNFLRDRATWLTPVRLGRPVCRDPKDDPFLECALAGQARFLVSRDPDLLVLGKPFGVEIVTPRQFLGKLKRAR